MLYKMTGYTPAVSEGVAGEKGQIQFGILEHEQEQEQEQETG